MNSIEIKKKVLEKGEVCDHCLGRQITFKYKGVPNGEIGAALRKSDSPEEVQKHIEEEDFEIKEKENCYICRGLFTRVDGIYEKLLEEQEKWEYKDFLIGCKVPEEIIDGEEKLWTEVPPEDAEPIKRQLKREIGKRMSKEVDKEPGFESPDIVFILNFKENKIETQVKSIYIYGRYKKLERGIPQTKWPCSNCGGEGCEECNQTGQQFPYTVEGIIADILLDMAEAEESKFHGAGREDRDALMLGNGRPFVIEAVRPVKRDIDINKLQQKVNEEAEDKIQVSEMRESDKDEVVELKSWRPDKTYEIWVETGKEVAEEELEKIEEEFQEKTVEQRTPTRVNHRRADKVRERKVHSVDTEKLDEDRFKAVVKAEAGTYVKELISGDYGRTRPSFAEVLENKAEPQKLNVVKIHGPDDD